MATCRDCGRIERHDPYAIYYTCTSCVMVLRQRIKALEAELESLREALGDVPETTQKTALEEYHEALLQRSPTEFKRQYYGSFEDQGEIEALGEQDETN